MNKTGYKEIINDLICDFISYACDGVTNPAPYCTNICADCVDDRICCKNNEYCKGFYPSAARALEEKRNVCEDM